MRTFFARAILSESSSLRTVNLSTASAILTSVPVIVFEVSFEDGSDWVHELAARKHHKPSVGTHEKNWGHLFISFPNSKQNEGCK